MSIKNFKNPWAEGGEYYPDYLGGEQVLNSSFMNDSESRNIVPGPDKLIYYKYDFRTNEWWGMNDWRIKKYPEFKKQMDDVSDYGKQIRTKVKNNFKLIDTDTRDNIIFSYTENEGEIASFKLNMRYVTKSGKKIRIMVPFYSLNEDSKFGNSLTEIVWSEISDLWTNCYADSVLLVGTIDHDADFINLLTEDGYNFDFYNPKTTKSQVNDILFFPSASHAMRVSSINSQQNPVLYTSNHRTYERMTDTFDEINFVQFYDTLKFTNDVVYARK